MDLAQPVYRFYHPAKDQHLYVDASDKMSKLASSPGEGWVSEGIAWYRCPEGNHPFDARPVYQFHSSGRGDLFCTANEREKDKLMNDPAHRWSYEGIVCYAIGPDTQ